MAALGHGAMAGSTAHIHTEPVGVGHAVARLAAYGTRVHLAPNMHAKDAIHAFAYTLFNHKNGALAVFFRGLKHGAHFAVDLIGHAAQNLQCAKQHGNVAVVAAGVHVSFVLTGVRNACLLSNGESIDIRA